MRRDHYKELEASFGFILNGAFIAPAAVYRLLLKYDKEAGGNFLCENRHRFWRHRPSEEERRMPMGEIQKGRQRDDCIRKKRRRRN